MILPISHVIKDLSLTRTSRNKVFVPGNISDISVGEGIMENVTT